MNSRKSLVLLSLTLLAGCDEPPAGNAPPLPTSGTTTGIAPVDDDDVMSTTTTASATGSTGSDETATAADSSSTTTGPPITTTGNDESTSTTSGRTTDPTDGTSSSSTTSGTDETTTSDTAMEGPDVGVLSGDAQTARINEQLAMPLVFEVTEMGVPVPGVEVTLTASPGAAISPASAMTDADGQVIALARVGRALGGYTFEAEVEDSPVTTATATATEPTAGTMLSLVNADKVLDDNVGVPGPGTAATIGEVSGVAIASDDTVYISADTSNHGYIYALDAAGHMTVLAGGGAVESEDCIPPLTADLRRVEDVLYDEPNDLVYLLADYNGWRLLELDVASDTLCTVAGGDAMAPGPTYGDDGAATAATLVGPSDIDLGPDGALYITDRNIDRIRRVSGGVITSYLEPGDCDDRIAMNDCGSDGCEMAWDEQGNLFVNARICGSEVGGTANGVVRYNPGADELVHIAGQNGGSTAESALSFDARFDGLGGIAFDEAGNLYVIENQTERVRRIDATTYRTTTVVNIAEIDGALGDYGAAIDAQLDDPARLVFSAAGDLLIADRGNAATRMVWGLGEVMATEATLAIATAVNPSSELLEPTLFVAEVVDGSSDPFEGLRVGFEGIDAGACVDPTTDLADDAGLAATFARPGLLAGDYQINAVYEDLHGVSVSGSPVEMTISAAVPAVGDALTLVNDTHVDGNAGVPGAGTCARVGGVTGVSAGSDGSVFLVDRNSGDGRLRLLSPEGDLVDIAGGGSDETDGIPALNADISVVGDVQFDEANNRVFFTGTFDGASRVLRVNLASTPPQLFVYGGQPDALPGDGDGGLATSAHFLAAGDLAVDPTNPTALYVVDAGHDRIRRIDGLTIDGVYGINDGDCAADAIALSDCADCNIAFAPDGNAMYVFGRICGSDPGGATPGIVRLDLNGADEVTSITHIAGSTGGDFDWAGLTGPNARFSAAGGLVVGADDNLYFAETNSHQVGRLDLSTNVLSIVMGDGSAGSNGNHGPAVSARLNEPVRLEVRNGSDLLIADEGNHAVRMVWDLFDGS
ncbi:MAG: hypothetical protein ACRBN8_34395 [Nannocystales bacterium]